MYPYSSPIDILVWDWEKSFVQISSYEWIWTWSLLHHTGFRRICLKECGFNICEYLFCQWHMCGTACHGGHIAQCHKDRFLECLLDERIIDASHSHTFSLDRTFTLVFYSWGTCAIWYSLNNIILSFTKVTYFCNKGSLSCSPPHELRNYDLWVCAQFNFLCSYIRCQGKAGDEGFIPDQIVCSREFKAQWWFYYHHFIALKDKPCVVLFDDKMIYFMYSSNVCGFISIIKFAKTWYLTIFMGLKEMSNLEILIDHFVIRV